MKKITLLISAISFVLQLQAQLTPDNTCTTTFDDISATGTDLMLGDDDEATITIPFSFTLDGVSSSDLVVGDNGGVLFGVTTGNVGTSSTPTAQGFYPFADDMDSDYGTVVWETLGAAPNRRVVIMWNDRPHYSNSSSGGTFELILYETSNEITFLYQDVDFGNASYDDGVSAGILVVGANGTYTYSTNTALAGVTCINWTVPTCPSPTSLASANITSSSADLTWSVGGTETDWEYALLLSSDPAPSSGTATTMMSYDATSLSDNTEYTFYLRADCGGGDTSDWISTTFTTLALPPANDDCAGAIDLDSSMNTDGSCTITYTGTNAGSTNSAGEVAPSGTCSDTDATPSDIWFSLTVPSTGGFIYDDIVTPGFSSIVEVYTGSCGGLTPLNPVNCSNSSNEKTFDGLTPGNTVYLRYWDYGSDEEGALEFCIKQIPPPIVPDYSNDFSTYPGTGWTEASGAYGSPTGTSSSWISDDYGNDTGSANGQSARVEIWSTSTDEYLISPNFDLSGGTYYLNFDIALTVWNTTASATLGADDYVALLVSQDGTTWSELRRWDSSSTIGTSREPTPEIELTGYNSTTKFAFYAFSDTSNEDNNFYVDNFQITNFGLSIEDNIIEGFTLYPNPVTDRLYLTAVENIDDISIYNLLGQEVINSRPEVSNADIDMSELPTGMYVVKVRIGEQLGSYRIVKE